MGPGARRGWRSDNRHRIRDDKIFFKQGNILSYFRATTPLIKRAGRLLLPINSELFQFL
jgi:hypothetical protein